MLGGRIMGGNHPTFGDSGHSLRLRRTQNTRTASLWNVEEFSALRVEFKYLARGTEEGDSFALQTKFNGEPWKNTTVWKYGENFGNTFQQKTWNDGNAVFDVPSNKNNVRIRLKAFGDKNNDIIYIDNFVFSGEALEELTETPTRAPIENRQGSESPVEDDPFEKIFEDSFEDEGNIHMSANKVVEASESNPTYDNSGHSLRLVRKQGASTNAWWDIRDFSTLKVEFKYFAKSMEETDTFILQSRFNGSPWSTEKTWRIGDDFQNGIWNDGEIEFDVPSNKIKAKIRLKAVGDQGNDQIFIDNVVFSGEVSSNASTIIDGDSNDVNCVVCDDVPTPGMKEKNGECRDFPDTMTKKCIMNNKWISNGFCKLSCHNAGFGYPDAVCCNGI